MFNLALEGSSFTLPFEPLVAPPTRMTSKCVNISTHPSKPIPFRSDSGSTLDSPLPLLLPSASGEACSGEGDDANSAGPFGTVGGMLALLGHSMNETLLSALNKGNSRSGDLVVEKTPPGEVIWEFGDGLDVPCLGKDVGDDANDGSIGVFGLLRGFLVGGGGRGGRRVITITLPDLESGGGVDKATDSDRGELLGKALRWRDLLSAGLEDGRRKSGNGVKWNRSEGRGGGGRGNGTGTAIVRVKKGKIFVAADGRGKRQLRREGDLGRVPKLIDFKVRKRREEKRREEKRREEKRREEKRREEKIC